LNCSLDPWVAGLEVLDHHPDGVDELMIFELRVSLRRVLDVRNPDVIAPLTAEGAAQPLAPIDLTSDDLRLPVAIAALALSVGAEGLLVPSAAWARYADDLPNIEMDRPLVRPGADPGNLIILHDHGLDRETATVYSGAAKLVPSVNLKESAGRIGAIGS
jgi:hypothetical protein